MHVDLPLSKMSILDKISTMESLWDSLCEAPEMLPSPDWHQDVLADREEAVSNDKARFSDLNEAKQRIRKMCQ